MKREEKLKKKTGPSGHRTHGQTVSEKRGKVFLRMMIQKGIDNDVSEEKKGASNEREEKEKKSGPSAHRTHGRTVRKGASNEKEDSLKKKSDSSGVEHTVELRVCALPTSAGTRLYSLNINTLGF